MKADVSIVIPTYNRQEYLAEAVESCLSQTYSDLELLVVDDGSTDDTPELMEHYLQTDSRVRYFRKENGGPADAMNYGCERADGEVLMFAASDDIQLPNKVQDSIDALAGYDFAYTGYYHANAQGVAWEYCPPYPITRESIIACKCASGGALVFWKRVWQQTPYRSDLRVNEDLALLIDFYKKGYSWNFLDVPTYKYRLLPDGMSYSRKAEVDALTQELIKELA